MSIFGNAKAKAKKLKVDELSEQIIELQVQKKELELTKNSLEQELTLKTEKIEHEFELAKSKFEQEKKNPMLGRFSFCAKDSLETADKRFKKTS